MSENELAIFISYETVLVQPIVSVVHKGSCFAFIKFMTESSRGKNWEIIIVKIQ